MTVRADAPGHSGPFRGLNRFFRFPDGLSGRNGNRRFSEGKVRGGIRKESPGGFSVDIV